MTWAAAAWPHMRSAKGRPAGQSMKLDALDDAGKPLTSGVYFYRISAAGTTFTREMAIAR